MMCGECRNCLAHLTFLAGRMSVVRGAGGECEMCMARGGASGVDFTNPVGTGVLCASRLRVWGVELDQDLEGWCYDRASLDSLCRWQVQVSVYCAWRKPAHLRCTQCSILLHLMDICFLTCICLMLSDLD